jgi:hypothetical protein
MTKQNESQSVDAALEAQKQRHYAGIFIVLWIILSTLGAIVVNMIAPDWMILGGFGGLILAAILAKRIVKQRVNARDNSSYPFKHEAKELRNVAREATGRT